VDYVILWLLWDKIFVVFRWIEKLVERGGRKVYFNIFGYGHGVIDRSLFMQIL